MRIDPSCCATGGQYGFFRAGLVSRRICFFWAFWVLGLPVLFRLHLFVVGTGLQVVLIGVRDFLFCVEAGVAVTVGRAVPVCPEGVGREGASAGVGPVSCDLSREGVRLVARFVCQFSSVPCERALYVVVALRVFGRAALRCRDDVSRFGLRVLRGACRSV